MREAGQSILGKELRPVTIAVLSPVAIVAFDALAVVSVLPSIAVQLGNVELLPWILTAFLFTSLGAVILGGAAIDGIGAKATFRTALVLFLTSSIACALAPSLPMLLVFRAVQGIGAGLFLSVALSTIGLAYPATLRPRVVALNSVVWAISSLVGPSLAAVLLLLTGWRGVFVTSAVLALAPASLAWRNFPGAVQGPQVRLDLPSFGLLMLFAGASLVGLSRLSVRSFAWLSVAMVAGAIYWWYSARVEDVVVPRRHLVRMPFGAINLAAAACFGATLGLNSYLPLYVQGALAREEHIAALSVGALALGWAGGSLAASRLIPRMSNAKLALWSSSLVAISFLAGAVLFSDTRSLPVVLFVFSVAGVGVGGGSVSLLTLLHGEADRLEVGRVTSVFQFVRSLAHTYATAIFGAVVLFLVFHQVGESATVRQVLAGEEASAEAATRSAIASGFRLATLLAAALGAIGAVAALTLHRKLPLPKPGTSSRTAGSS